jgi:hypothetical protein
MSMIEGATAEKPATAQAQVQPIATSPTLLVWILRSRRNSVEEKLLC